MSPSLLYDQLSPMALSPALAVVARDHGFDYRSLPRISDSDLTRIKEEQLGYQLSTTRWATDGTRTFGKASPRHLLEPETVGTVLEQLLPDLTDGRLTSGELTKLMTA